MIKATVYCLALPLLVAPQQVWGQDIEARIASTVRERGAVEAVDNEEIRSLLPGTSTIVWVVEEGTKVEKGDLLLKLDSSKVEQELGAAQVEVSEMQGLVRQAEADLMAGKHRLKSVTQLRDLHMNGAQLAKKAMRHEAELELEKLEGELRVRRAAMDAAEAKLAAWKKSPQAEQPIPPELKLESVAASEALAAAERQLKFLKEVALPQQAVKHEVAEKEMLLKLESEQLTVERELIALSSAVEAARTKSSLAKEKLQRLERQHAYANITAPRGGTVVYANQLTRTGGFRVEEGATVRERQVILRLPDLTTLQVRAAVNETRIRRVKVGQQAKVQLDGLPGVEFTGTVTAVSRLPRPTTSFVQGNVKEYDVIVQLSKAPVALRLGMTCLVEIRTQ